MSETNPNPKIRETITSLMGILETSLSLIIHQKGYWKQVMCVTINGALTMLMSSALLDGNNM